MSYTSFKHKKKKRNKGTPRRRKIMCHAVMVFAATAKETNITNFDTDSAMIGIDNRASGCFSHVSTDFVGPMRECNKLVKGFGGTHTSNLKIGTLKWSWLDDSGKMHTHYIENSYYSKMGGVRLLSPQHFSQVTNDLQGTGTKTNGVETILYWGNKKHKLTVPLSKLNNVATFHLAPGFNNFNTFCMEVCTQDKIKGQQKDSVESEVMHQYDLRHLDKMRSHWNTMTKQAFDTASKIDTTNTQENVQTPILKQYYRSHCDLGHIHEKRMQLMVKEGTLPMRFKNLKLPFCSSCAYGKSTRRNWRSKSSNNRDEASQPTHAGECISVDQLISPTPGLIAQMVGCLTTKRYTCATIFVDQYSSLSFVWIQKSTCVEETLMGKRAFETYARERGISIKRYHADNGVFRAHKWVEECSTKQQSLTFAAVGAHHQNGVAERRIRLLQEMTRTNLIHAKRRWPQAISTNLWPYALRMANNAWNQAPNPRDKSNLSPEQRFSLTNVQMNVKHSIPFGCPTYVLSSALQSRTPYHKWKERAEVGIYLGKSPQHSRNVALVMDRHSGRVSPQFHVRFDKYFESVTDQPIQCTWQVKAGFVRIPSTNHMENKHKEKDNYSPPIDPQPLVGTISENDITIDPPSSENSDFGQVEVLQTIIENNFGILPENEILCNSSMVDDDTATNLIAMKAQCDPDTMYHHQAMKEPDSDLFRQAMVKEVRDQMDNKNFDIVLRSSVPKGATILPAVWQMKRKRDIKTGTIKKYKARLNIDGSRMQKGKDFDLTYAPVATWNAIRLVLALVLINGWCTVQLDYVLAFPQAPIERQLYMTMPKGMKIVKGDPKDYVLKIKRNIYGQKQAGRVWNKFLVTKLTSKEIGFTQSKFDECVFYKNNIVYILYTDDSIIAGPNRSEIDKTIELIKKAQLNITIEGDLQDFLGIHIEKLDGGKYKMSQPQLIQKILEDLSLTQDNVNCKNIPMAASRILFRHQTSDAFDGSFNYRSIIGKLNYLEKATRPDIAYPSHQCARYSADPKVEHGAAIRWIGRYLKGTANKGMIFTPDTTMGLEVHVDSDFVGNWDKADTDNVDTAKSRHGYLITFAGCPICWKSQLQVPISLSSCEAEYIGLSASLREAIPIMNLIDEMKSYNLTTVNSTAKVHCKVFEDNTGALEMAREHKFRPRTKHIHIKYHHFREYVDAKRISIHSVSTHDQRADIFTKPLCANIFIKHRRKILGW